MFDGGEYVDRIVRKDIFLTVNRAKKNMEQTAGKSVQITEMLRELSDGKQSALDALLPLVYDELRREAARFLGRERVGDSLQPTAVLQEHYLNMKRRRRGCISKLRNERATLGKSKRIVRCRRRTRAAGAETVSRQIVRCG